MRNCEIKEILLEKGVKYLYHANTVETSLSFLKNGGLLSRGFCEDMGFPQTSQDTDETDKYYNIYNDIFFDSKEIQFITGISYYGPVLFVYNIDVLDSVKEGNIRITKLNPIRWKKTDSDSKHYFNELNELRSDFAPEQFGQHITLLNQRVPLSFDFLNKIIFSNPGVYDGFIFPNAQSMIQNAEIVIRNTMKDKKINVPLIIRNYNYYKRFFDTYNEGRKLIEHYGLGGHR